ncbi:hypothetical protein V3C99_008873 [Haemonchus contortus]
MAYISYSIVLSYPLTINCVANLWCIGIRQGPHRRTAQQDTELDCVFVEQESDPSLQSNQQKPLAQSRYNLRERHPDMSSFHRFEEYNKRKYDYNNLLRALPKLPEPDALLDKIVDGCRDVMYQCAVLDQLHDEIPFFSQTNEPWGELERDAHLVEQKPENCEPRFRLLRQTLRNLYASPPILVATGRLHRQHGTP